MSIRERKAYFLRCGVEDFTQTWEGRKFYEVRPARDYMVGDRVVLLEFKDENTSIEDRFDVGMRGVIGEITHITHGGMYGMNVMGFKIFQKYDKAPNVWYEELQENELIPEREEGEKVEEVQQPEEPKKRARNR